MIEHLKGNSTEYLKIKIEEDEYNEKYLVLLKMYKKELLKTILTKFKLNNKQYTYKELITRYITVNSEEKTLIRRNNYEKNFNK